MRAAVRSQKVLEQMIFAFLFALFSFYLLYEFSLLQVLGLIGIAIILIISILKLQSALIVLLAIKPFIDLAWNAYFFSLAYKSISALHIVGFYIFIVAGSLYLFDRNYKSLFNEKIIWLFLFLNLFSSSIAIIVYGHKIIGCIDGLLRVFDAYLIYFIFARYLESTRSKLYLIKIIWISTLLVSALSIIIYSTGHYYIDITQQVVRYAGLYNDPGTPSYMAIMSLVFGTLYVELIRKTRRLNLLNLILFAFTILATLSILKITITKSAFVMLAIFLIMWPGIYKKRIFLVLPLMIFGGLLVYQSTEVIQKRMENEVKFLQRGQINPEAARSLGTGRVSHWERVINYYIQNYDIFQKLFGNYRNFGAHNQYIAYLMEVGIVGLTIFLIILFCFYKRLIYLFRKLKSPDLYMAIVVLSMLTIYGITGHPFESTTLLWYMTILLSLINVKTREVEYKDMKKGSGFKKE